MAAILDPSTVILFNIYLIIGLQLAFNWDETGCNTESYLFQLGFIVMMFLRLIFYEIYNNKVCGKCVHAVFMFLIDGLLIALGAYQAYTLASHSEDFYFDPKTEIGSLTCFQNRIVFVAEIAIIGLTFFKDIYFLCIRSGEEPVEPENK